MAGKDETIYITVFTLGPFGGGKGVRHVNLTMHLGTITCMKGLGWTYCKEGRPILREAYNKIKESKEILIPYEIGVDSLRYTKVFDKEVSCRVKFTASRRILPCCRD